MFDFTSLRVVDNHCHPMDPKKAVLESGALAREFYHGIGDLPQDGVRPRAWDATDDLKYHFPFMGVVQTMIRQLSRVLDCEPTLEAVADARNQKTSAGFGNYARLLYDDAKIVATIVDRAGADDDPAMQLFPGKVMKMFQMDSTLKDLLQECDSYQELSTRYGETLDRFVKQDGYVGVKSHLAETFGFGSSPVSESEAEAAVSLAKSGDMEASAKVYMAIFMATMRQCQELQIPLHLHSGFTGGIWDGPISNADPFLLVPLLQQPDFVQTRIVLLHAAQPAIQKAAAMAHAFPHVWVDMGWTSPWLSLRMTECYRDVIGMAPLSKIMIGSGGHGTPEIAWLAALTSKIGLAEALGDTVRLNLITQQHAESAGRMILHDNAARMYGLPG